MSHGAVQAALRLVGAYYGHYLPAHVIIPRLPPSPRRSNYGARRMSRLATRKAPGPAACPMPRTSRPDMAVPPSSQSTPASSLLRTALPRHAYEPTTPTDTTNGLSGSHNNSSLPHAVPVRPRAGPLPLRSADTAALRIELALTVFPHTLR